jgi:hypothetical protein
MLFPTLPSTGSCGLRTFSPPASVHGKNSPIPHLVDRTSSHGAKCEDELIQLRLDAVESRHSRAKKRYQKSAPHAMILVITSKGPEMQDVKTAASLSRQAKRGGSLEEASKLRLSPASLPRRPAVIYLLSPEELRALPRPPATSRSPRHAPRSRRCHARPWIPKSLRRTPPPR